VRLFDFLTVSRAEIYEFVLRSFILWREIVHHGNIIVSSICIAMGLVRLMTSTWLQSILAKHRSTRTAHSGRRIFLTAEVQAGKVE